MDERKGVTFVKKYDLLYRQHIKCYRCHGPTAQLSTKPSVDSAYKEVIGYRERTSVRTSLERRLKQHNNCYRTQGI